MRIQADNLEDLDDAIKTHQANGHLTIETGVYKDGTHFATFTRKNYGEWEEFFDDVEHPTQPQDHPAISAAAVELRKLGVSYATAKPILRRVFNAGKGAGQ